MRLHSGEKKSGRKSIEFIIPDVKPTKALSPSNLLNQIHWANKSLVTCITLQLQSMITISMCLIYLGSFVDLIRILLDKDKHTKCGNALINRSIMNYEPKKKSVMIVIVPTPWQQFMLWILWLWLKSACVLQQGWTAGAVMGSNHTLVQEIWLRFLA